MRTHYLGLALLAAGYLALTGCDPANKTNTPPGGTTLGTAEEHGHSHDHDHAGGPHGGDIIELGDEAYHAELVHKEKSSVVAVYLLDAEMKEAVPIEAQEITLNLTVAGTPTQYKLLASPLEGEADGQSSRFELDEAILADLLSGDVTGRLNVTIGGTDYVGDFDHHAHSHEHGDHDHADHDHGEEGHDHEGEEDHDHADGEEDHDHAGEDHDDEGEEGHDHADNADAN